MFGFEKKFISLRYPIWWCRGAFGSDAAFFLFKLKGFYLKPLGTIDDADNAVNLYIL